MKRVIVKKTLISCKLIFTVISTYVKLYRKYLLNSFRSLIRAYKNKSDDLAVEIRNDELDDEIEPGESKGRKEIGKLEYRKASAKFEDLVNLESLIQINFAERCAKLFECTIENYQFRFLTVVLVIFNVACFLNQEFCWTRTIIFLFFQLLLTNLPFSIYLLNVLQYYKMRLKIEIDFLVSNSSTNQTRCFLAFENDHCIGYSIVFVEDDQAELVNIFITDEFRNSYIGKHLLNSTLFHLKVNRVPKVVCLVEASNCGSVGFMESNGFEVMDKLPLLSKSGYSKLIDSIRSRHRSTYFYFRVLNFYYLFFEIDLCNFR